jgi:hypothetical protein
VRQGHRRIVGHSAGQPASCCCVCEREINIFLFMRRRLLSGAALPSSGRRVCVYINNSRLMKPQRARY